MDLRPSPIAGSWYPGQPDVLAEAIGRMLAEADTAPPDGPIVAVIVPHAGHRFSGPVAAHAFKPLQGAPVKVVAILCPSHRHADAPIITSAHSAYVTPLGSVEVDQARLTELRQALGALVGVRGPLVGAIRRDREHAIEIELPFLQVVLPPGFTLLPLMLADQSRELAAALGQALAAVLRHVPALIVGSSDLSHFMPQAVAHELDHTLLAQIDAFDPDGVLEAEASGRGRACGHGAIAATLWAARRLGATHSRVVHYATSGDVNHEYAEVVGYGAALVWRERAAPAAYDLGQGVERVD